ncbi:MAG: RNase adaptor protein RapZ, partial [Methylococcus sp.]
MELIIVSGLSGSGKSIALETLEDSGYYCIDNLPINLFEPFVQGARQEAEAGQIYRKVAISIDARSRCESLQQFPDTLELAMQMGISCQVMFLKAGAESLLKRFSETRRKHPLTDRSRSLTEAIALESSLLVPIASRADLVIDTSHTNIHQLRDLIRERIGAKRDHRMS